MAGAAGAGMRHPRLVGLHPGRELGLRVRGERLSRRQHQRIVVDHPDRREILLGVERQRLVERDVGRKLQIGDVERVAVGRRARDALACDVCAAAADVLDDEVLAELGGEFRRKLARHQVGRPAGRVGHDDGDGPRRIGLRLRGRGAEQHRQSDGENCLCHSRASLTLLPKANTGTQAAPLLGLHVAGRDDLDPLLDLAVDVGAVFLRRGADRVEAELDQFLGELGILHRTGA